MPQVDSGFDTPHQLQEDRVMMIEKQYIHFSFDDVYQCLKDISDHADSYQSVFKNELFAWMKEMHEKYGAVFSLYTFNYFSEQPGYDISDLPDRYAEELAASADWLKFGFHARDDKKKYNVDEPEQVKADYEKFLEAIRHAAGNNPDCLDRVVRLGFFAGTEANVLALRDCEPGILGLLTADNDDKRLSYYFGKEKTAWVNQIGEFWEHGLLFLRSQLRMELVEDVDALVEKMCGYTEPKVIELFTHESSWSRESRVKGWSVRQLCEELIRRSFEAGYGFGFAQELYYVEGDDL